MFLWWQLICAWDRKNMLYEVIDRSDIWHWQRIAARVARDWFYPVFHGKGYFHQQWMRNCMKWGNSEICRLCSCFAADLLPGASPTRLSLLATVALLEGICIVREPDPPEHCPVYLVMFCSVDPKWLLQWVLQSIYVAGIENSKLWQFTRSEPSLLSASHECIDLSKLWTGAWEFDGWTSLWLSSSMAKAITSKS